MPRIIAPLNYAGGKAKEAPRIVEYLPIDMRLFVDVFGGGGHVTTAVNPAIERVFNDIVSDVPNFFLVLKNHTDELVRQLERMPYSRSLHREITEWRARGCPGPVTDIDRAARWMFIIRSSFRGKVGAGYGYSRGKAGGGTAGAFLNATRRLELIAELWRGVNIECLDFADLIPRYDAPTTVFYSDSPYIGSEGEYPEAGFKAEDHQRLADVLSGIQGRALVNYFDHPDLKNLYPKEKWKRRKRSVSVSSKINNRGAEGSKPKADLIYLFNYDPKTGQRLTE